MKIDITTAVVRVKLTDKGRAVHAAKHALWLAESVIKVPYRARHEDADGWSEWDLWELMRDFGDVLFSGPLRPFEDEMEILEKQE